MTSSTNKYVEVDFIFLMFQFAVIFIHSGDDESLPSFGDDENMEVDNAPAAAQEPFQPPLPDANVNEPVAAQEPPIAVQPAPNQMLVVDKCKHVLKFLSGFPVHDLYYALLVQFCPVVNIFSMPSCHDKTCCFQ